MSNYVCIDDIVYVNTNKREVTDRVIIRVTPPENITAIDVTGMEKSEQIELAALYQEYLDWRDAAAKAIPSFESWAEQQANQTITPKWKAFKRTHIIQR